MAASFTLIASPAYACIRDGYKTKCDETERREGGDEEGEETGRPNNPEKGDEWREFRYTKCVEWDAEHPNEGDPDSPSCYGGDPESCAENEDWYWVDVRVWTYDGSDWQYDETIGTDGWETHDVGCYDPTGQVTEDMVIRAINSREMPAGEVGANPPNGRTLVDLDTVFYTDQGEERFVLPLEEVNVEVDVIATPTSYNWDFGNGATDSFDTKGKPWERGVPMSEYNTHTYHETGNFDVTLTIDYEVQYNDGSGWQTISEPITSRPSDPYPIEVLEKRNRLRGGN